MTIAFNWQNNTYNATAGTSIALTNGGNTITSGDLLIGAVSVVNNTVDPGSITPPSGFSIITAGTIVGNSVIKPSDSGYNRYAIFYKIAGSSETGSYTASWTNSNVSSWVLLDYAGVNNSTPFDGGAETVHNSGYGVTLTAPAITTTVNNDLEIFFFTGYGGGVTATMPGGSVNTRVNQSATTSSANWIGIADLSIPTAGTQSTQTVTYAFSTDGWGAISFGIQPSSGGGVVVHTLPLLGVGL